MQTFRIISDSEKQRFNDYVIAQNGHATQSFEGGEPERCRGWQPRAVVLEKNSEIIASMVALLKPVPLCPRWQMMDIVNGPVADYSDADTCQALVTALIDFARAQKVVYLKVNPFVARDTGFIAMLSASGFVASRSHWRYR